MDAEPELNSFKLTTTNAILMKLRKSVNQKPLRTRNLVF